VGVERTRTRPHPFSPQSIFLDTPLFWPVGLNYSGAGVCSFFSRPVSTKLNANDILQTK